VRRAVRAGGMSISLRNNEPGLPLHRQGSKEERRFLVAWPIPFFAPGPAGVSPARVEEPGGHRTGRDLGSREPSPPADHPLMERGLHIFEMEETANPMALARSRLVHDRLPPEYAATRARRAINLKAVKNSNDDLSSLVMLPDGPLVSGLFPLLLYSSARCRRDSDVSSFPAEGGRECSTVRPAHAPNPSERVRRSGGNRCGRHVRSGGSSCGNARSRGMKNSGCASSRDSPPATSEDSSSGDEKEEESDGGRASPERWEPAPPH
jgi:hypothetical protein